MLAVPPARRWKRLLWPIGFALAAIACGKREQAEAVPRPPAPPPVAEPAPAPVVPVPVDTVPAGAPPPAKLAFASHPPRARLGKPYIYKPSLDFPGAATFRLAKAGDSGMRWEKGRLLWTPGRPGSYPVLLEAEAGGLKARQGFTLEVPPVLELSLKPLPVQAAKGDTVRFDLRASRWPGWAAREIALRFDWEGDGRWDHEEPAAAGLVFGHAYDAPGRYGPKVEARYGEYEIRQAVGGIEIVGSVTAALKISPDTVEPGGTYSVDASASKAEGRLAFFLDLDGDGKYEWIDSASGKAALRAPASGLYRAVLTARDPQGQEGKAAAELRVNARPRIEFRVRNPKDNMAAGVDFKVRASDADDSILAVRFALDGKEWEERKAPDTASSAREWHIRLRRSYGRVGTFAPRACVFSADGRAACADLRVDIFNAPPVCRPGADLKATVGAPVAIDGDGTDPDGKIVKWEWDLDGDGRYDLVSSENGKFQYTFGREGVFDLVLRVTTADGMTATGRRKVEVRKKWKS